MSSKRFAIALPCVSRSWSLPINATKTASRSGPIARPMRWVATILIVAARDVPNSSFLPTARSYLNTGASVVASARAGNVIGGGDWARDRLMTDIIAALVKGERPIIRSPKAVRPWQHVLEPLSGYLRSVEYLWEHRPKHPECWNFGPDNEDEGLVIDIARLACTLWGFDKGPEIVPDPRSLHEAHLPAARFQQGARPNSIGIRALTFLRRWA